MKNTPEAIEQKKFIKWLKLKNIFHFAVVNENNMSSNNKKMAQIIGQKSIEMGKKKGVSDVIVMLPDKILFIEMKRARKRLKSGKLSQENLASKEQLQFIDNVNSFEYSQGFVAYGFIEAKNIVESFIN